MRDALPCDVSGSFLNSVALKIVPNASDLTPPVLLITPPTPTAFTTTVDNGLNANGCAGGVDGFFCSQATGNGVAAGAPGDIYTFEWAVTVNSLGNLLTGNMAASVKALYVDSTGKQNGITSEGITLSPGGPPPVPEPSSLALLGTGALGIAYTLRRQVRF